MRILFVAPTYFDEQSVVGGGERYVSALAEALNAHSTIDVLSFGKNRKQSIQNGVPFEILKAGYFKHFNLTNPFCLKHFFHIGKQQYDIIHIHQLCTFVSDIACLAAYRTQTPVVGTDHGGGGAWVLNNRIDVFSKYKAVIGQSQLASNILETNFPKEKIHTIPGGVNTEAFQLPVKSKERNSILFVGRLMPHKGVHTLIEAFHKVKDTKLNLTILGRPHESGYYEQLQNLKENGPNKDRIRFLTDANDAELKQAYQQAKASVIPSEQDENGNLPPELMGFTTMESQASGTPMIVSDGGPMSEFIENGKTGLIFKNRDAGDLARKIEELTTHPDFAEPEIHRKCREHGKKFSWNSVAEQHLTLYEKIVSETDK